MPAHVTRHPTWVLRCLLGLALLVVLVPWGSARAATSPPTPATPSFGSAIEGYAAYEPGVTCDPVNRPGATMLANLIKQTYGQDQVIGIARNACYTISEHNEGRALDWMLNANDPTQMAEAKAFLHWLFATDKYGHTDAMARRLGVMYVIWNDHMWRSYDHGKWGSYSGSDSHTTHIHISLSLDGATGRTSFWTGKPLAGQCPETAPTSPAPGVPRTPMVFVPVPPKRIVTTATGWGVGGNACRLFAASPYFYGNTRLDARVTGVGGVPTTGVAAVALQVTMSEPNAYASVSAGPTGGTIPGVARVSAPLNGSGSSLVVLPVGAGGKVSFRTSMGATDLGVDVVGYYLPVGTSLSRSEGPASVFDPVPVWNAVSPTAPIAAHTSKSVQVAGQSGVSTSATAALVNISVLRSPGKGRVFAYAAGAKRPWTPVITYHSMHRYTVQTVVPLSSNGSLTVSNLGLRGKPIRVDVVGAYVPPGSPGGLGYVAKTKIGTVASTSRNIAITTLDSGDTKVIGMARLLPPQAKAALLNISVVNPRAETTLNLWGATQPRPATVAFTGRPGQTVSGSVVVPLSALRHFKLRNVGADGVNITVSLAGYFE